MARRPGYYILRFVAVGALYAGGWTAFALVGPSWWTLVVAAFLAVVYGQVAMLAHDVAHRQVFRLRRAAEVTGRIRSIDDTDHMLTLSNGQQYKYVADPGEPNLTSVLDGFHVGETVRIQHNGGSATGITALN